MRLGLEIALILIATALKKTQGNSQSIVVREQYLELIAHSDLFCSGISGQGSKMKYCFEKGSQRSHYHDLY